MPEGTYELVQAADGYIARITARGHAVLATPTINRGTAFTLAERRGARADRAAAHRGVDDGGAAAAGLRAVPAAAQRPGQVRVPGEPAGPQRGAVLPAAHRAHRRDAADRLHPDGRGGDRAVQPRVPPPPRGVPVGRPPGGGRDRPAQHRAGRRRRRPDRGHRLRGHPRHRRLGRRRHRDRDRQARRLHRGGRHPSPPGAAGGAGRRHRQPGPAQRRAVPGRAARPGPRRSATTSSSTPTSPRSPGCSRTRCCTGRTSAPSNARRILDSYADQLLHLQRRHAGHRRGRAGRGALRGAGGRRRGCATSGW